MPTNNGNATVATGSSLSPGREDLLLKNLPEVHYIARQIHRRLPSCVSLEDLVHAGILGLIEAVDRFEANRNTSFKSYANFRIRGAVIDSLRRLDWSPRALRRDGRRIERARRDLATEFGRSPSEPELAAHLQMSVEHFQRILADLCGVGLYSLQDSCDGDHIQSSYGPAASRAEEDPFREACRAEVSVILAMSITDLDVKQRQVITLYYFNELTMKQVATTMGIGESRVSQIHAAALIALRAGMQGRIDGAPGALAAPAMKEKNRVP